MARATPPPDRWPHLCQQACVQRENHFSPVPMTEKTRFHATGFPPVWAELGSSTGTFAQMRIMLDHLTLLYVLHRPILS